MFTKYKRGNFSLSQLYIQGVPGRKFNILGGHSFGHSKQKTLYEHVSYSERLPGYIHLNVNRFTQIHTLQTVAQHGGREEQYLAPKPNHHTVKWLYLGNRLE
jgi:hypothetical protein